MQIVVANVGITIAANVTMLVPLGESGARRVLEQPRPAASTWPHPGVVPEPAPQESGVLPTQTRRRRNALHQGTPSTQSALTDHQKDVADRIEADPEGKLENG